MIDVLLFEEEVMNKTHEALYYKKLEGDKILCQLCPNLCKIAPGKKGRCNVRKNIAGKLYTLNYGLTTTGSKDPIEKKPLYHFLPGTCAYSFGTVGCNLFCQFCQNWHIARGTPEELDYALVHLSPEAAAKEAKKTSCQSVAYTYNEPFIWYEWILATAKKVKENKQKNILVTNGYVEEAPLRQIAPFIDAANIDIKGDEDFYQELCKVSHHETVLRTAKIMKEQHIHVEITNLLIPGKNDSTEQLENLAKFVVQELGSDVPLHFSRYFPNYKLSIPPTPVETLHKAREIAEKAGVEHIYLGNLHSNEGNDTLCKNCGATLIKRRGYFIDIQNLDASGACKKCNTPSGIVTS
jgi:pyruvate formate lyase activating enzyme